eukprot:gene1294-1267_t
MPTSRLPSNWIHHRYLPLAVGVCSSTLAALLAWVVIDISHTKARAEIAAQAQSHLLQIRDRLDRQLQSTLSVPETVSAFIAAQGSMSPDIFATVVGRLLEHQRNIRNLALAPDNVISDVYPRVGNERAIGLRYLDNPQQRGAVERAIQTRRTVVAGPIPLVQGGLGIISRTPVFLAHPPGRAPVGGPRYWGIVSLTVNADTLFADVGLNSDQMGFQVAARGLDAMGAQGAVFIGRSQLFDEEPATLDVPLPGGGSWILGAVPTGGWGAAGRAPVLVVMLAYAFALVLGLLSARLVRAHQQAAMEMAQKVLAALVAPIGLDSGQHVLTGASIGVALFQGPAVESMPALMDRADRALYTSKRSGKGLAILAEAPGVAEPPPETSTPSA